MQFKSNLNRIHFLLTESFDKVSIMEKYDQKLGNYIELSILENIECKVVIKKKDLISENFNWIYLTNPLMKDSDTISRKSSIDSFTSDIKDIIDNKKFDIDYINTYKNN